MMKRIVATLPNRKRAAWTPQEDATVVALHSNYNTLLKELPHRTYNALRQRARHLGVVRPRHIWTNKEVDRLCRASAAYVRSDDITNFFPHLRPTQVYAKARHLNLDRGRRLKDFDDPVLSEIRARAIQMKLTLRDLDERAGSGLYFQKSSRKFQLRRVASAVATLDGQISIEWGVA